jgi:hypothetical protein
MPTQRFYVTTAIPYVNAPPHLGFAWRSCRPTCWPGTAAGVARRCGS